MQNGKNEKTIRVLHIVTNMSYGGLENLLMNYYRHIDRKTIQFDFLTHYAGRQDFEEEIKSLGGKLFRIRPLNPFSIRYQNELTFFFKSHPEYRIVHCHLNCMAGVPLRVALKCGIPVRIAHAHSSNQVHNIKYPVKLFFKRSIPRYSTALFACGKEAGDWMFGKNAYYVMRNAVDAAAFEYNTEKDYQMREVLGICGKFVVGHVGQFRIEKNHLFIIDVFKRIVELQPNSCLILVGKGGQYDNILARIKEHKLENHVLLLGARDDIAEIMQSFDIFLLPSIHEGLPVTMIEAQAAGLSCFISDGVPIECDITGNVKQISLTDGIDNWASAILEKQNEAKMSTYATIANAGYDIYENAKKIEEFYVNANK